MGGLSTLRRFPLDRVELGNYITVTWSTSLSYPPFPSLNQFNIKGLSQLFFWKLGILSFNPAEYNFIPYPSPEMEFYSLIRFKIKYIPFNLPTAFWGLLGPQGDVNVNFTKTVSKQMPIQSQKFLSS